MLFFSHRNSSSSSRSVNWGEEERNSVISHCITNKLSLSLSLSIRFFSSPRSLCAGVQCHWPAASFLGLCAAAVKSQCEPPPPQHQCDAGGAPILLLLPPAPTAPPRGTRRLRGGKGGGREVGRISFPFLRRRCRHRGRRRKRVGREVGRCCENNNNSSSSSDNNNASCSL